MNRPDCAQGISESPSLLLVGFGNASRSDDSVALHIIQRLRAQLGLPVDRLDDEQGDVLGDGLKMMFLHQLAPELAETVSLFDVVVFIDAHVEGAGWDPVAWWRIEPVYTSSMITHQLKPSVVLALSDSLYGRCPEAYTLSVLGHDFDFGEELAPDTSALADQAVSRLIDLLALMGVMPHLH